MAAVAAVGAAGGHIFFPVKGYGTVTATAANDCDPYFIYKHEHTSLKRTGFPTCSLHGAGLFQRSALSTKKAAAGSVRQLLGFMRDYCSA